MKTKIRTFLAKVKTLAMLAVAAVGTTVVAFASEPPVTPIFDLTEIMSTAATKIVTDLTSMIAGVLPVMITLLAVSVGIAYGLRFIKSITKKAG